LKPLIECKAVTLAYDGCNVVENLNFSVNQGDYLCIIGENGSGKTTLMKTLLGLLKPAEGEIIYNSALKQNEIGYLPQQSNIQRDFPASVSEIVLSGTLNRRGLLPFYSEENRKDAKKNLELLGIGELAKNSYQNLSGGQQRRALLARALCATSKLLLLDEPVAGLDPTAADEMYSVIRMLNREQGLTVIMISHDIAAVDSDSTHILQLHQHHYSFGTAEEHRNKGLKAEKEV